MKSLAVILAVLIAINGALLTEIAMYARNTFGHHPEWFPGKMLMQRQPISIYDTIRTRNMTARNRLNLAAWHGMQEALLNQVVTLDRARFRLRLEDEAYVVVIVSMTRDGMTGFMLSRFGGMPSCFFRAEPGGRFLETSPLPAITDRNWHQVDVTPGLTVTLDGQNHTWKKEVGPGLFGFRGSFAHCEVDDVSVWGGGKLLVQDNFRNDRNWRAVALHCLALLTVVTLLGVLLLHRRRRGTMWVILGHFLLLAFLTMFFIVDYSVWSDRYNELEPPEQFRKWLFDSLEGIDPAGFGEPSPAVLAFMDAHQPPKSQYRIQVYRDGHTLRLKDDAEAVRAFRSAFRRIHPSILVLGASQAGGEGAVKLDDMMLWQLYERVGGEVINACLQGSDSHSLVARYMTHLRLFQPDLVVAYHGSNDVDPEQLRGNLYRLYNDTRRAGSRLLLVYEANSPENPADFPPQLEKKLAVMREVARELGLPVVDLQGTLSRPELVNSGLLWWDAVHPTSYAHIEAGKALAEGVERARR